MTRVDGSAALPVINVAPLACLAAGTAAAGAGGADTAEAGAGAADSAGAGTGRASAAPAGRAIAGGVVDLWHHGDADLDPDAPGQLDLAVEHLRAAVQHNLALAHWPAVVASLGVSMYLTREANLATLRQLAALAPGSTLVMTFQPPLDRLEPAAVKVLHAAPQSLRVPSCATGARRR